jgi:hypothetical protein
MPNIAAMLQPLSNTNQATLPNPLHFPAEKARATMQSTPIFKLKTPILHSYETLLKTNNLI